MRVENLRLPPRRYVRDILPDTRAALRVVSLRSVSEWRAATLQMARSEIPGDRFRGDVEGVAHFTVAIVVERGRCKAGRV